MSDANTKPEKENATTQPESSATEALPRAVRRRAVRNRLRLPSSSVEPTAVAHVDNSPKPTFSFSELLESLIEKRRKETDIERLLKFAHNFFPPSPLSTLLPSSQAKATLPEPLAGDVTKLNAEIAETQANVSRQADELRKQGEALQLAQSEKTATESQKRELLQRLDQLSKAHASLQKQKDLGYLLDRVCDAAAKKLLADSSFVKRFEEARTCKAFVLAIDIRRSTDLMLRGKTPQLYAEFLNAVCGQLVAEIKDHYGVVDKFTGDGLLAYFPDFFTGNDSGFHALGAAQACHAIFAQSYRAARSSFTVALKDVGLGIGIDFGEVHLLRVTGELTVVGAPVVYACRLSGAPAGQTFMNHSAVGELTRSCPQAFESKEVDFDVKHEGVILCQNVTLAHVRYEPASPVWLVRPTESVESAASEHSSE